MGSEMCIRDRCVVADRPLKYRQWTESIVLVNTGLLSVRKLLTVKRMVIENSIESRIVELQNKKSAMIEAAIGQDDSAMNRLSVDDLQFLFAL